MELACQQTYPGIEALYHCREAQVEAGLAVILIVIALVIMQFPRSK